MDVYVFAAEADPGLVDQRREIGKEQRLRFIASTTGAFQAFGVLEVEGLRELPDLLKETFGNPTAKGIETAVPLRPGPMMIRWTKQYAHVAFSRIRSKAGRAHEVLGATSTVAGYNGSALVAGAFDLLVEYGADEFDSLQHALLHGLHDTRGIAWSDTAIVSRYFYRENPEAGR
jgi:hypothetical protein